MTRRKLVMIAVGASAVVGGLSTWSVVRVRASRRSVAAAAPAHPNQLTSLVNQDGQAFSFERLKGRTVALNFIFTHCPVSCPVQTKALTAVQRAIPKAPPGRVQFISVTMDPARDTPAVMKRYALALGADLSNWTFVTGSADEIAWLHEHFNAQVKATDGGQFDHRVAVYLLDANQRLLQTYAHQPLDERRLIDEIQTVDRLFNKS